MLQGMGALPRAAAGLAGALAIALSAGAACACVPEEARARWAEVERMGIVRGVGMLAGTPTVAVNRQVWSAVSLPARIGLIETLECVVVGPGRVLQRVDVVDPGGLPLARFDGLLRQLGVLR